MAARSRRGFPVRVLQEPDWNPLWLSGGGGGGGSGSRSLFDRLVGGMQDHLDEMERMRVVLLDAYPLLALDAGDAGEGGGLQARKGARRAGGGSGCGSGRGSGRSTVRAHHFALDLSGFSPEEVKVSLDGRKLTVRAKSERRAEAEDGCLSYDARELRRELLLPDDTDLEAVSTALALDGRLCIEAPRQAPPPPPQERVIPITVVAPKDHHHHQQQQQHQAEEKGEAAEGSGSE